MIKVSIIVPVFNVEKYLKKCLDSLVNQTFKDIEIIVVNDGSPDNSQKIINKYVEKYSQKIISITKENGGQGSARNMGITLSKGEYICFVDSDDYVEKKMIEKLYNKAIKTNSDIVICGNYVVNTDNEILKEERAITISNKKNIVSDCILSKTAVWNKIYKKELIKNIEFRNKVWYEDLDYNTKCILSAKKITILDEPLYYYVLREGSTMNNSNVQKNLEIIDAFKCIYKDIDNNILTKYEKEMDALLINHMLATIVRVIIAKANNNAKKEIIDKLKKYIIINLRGNCKQKYISRNKRILLFLIKCKTYKFIKLLFIIKGRKNHAKRKKTISI